MKSPHPLLWFSSSFCGLFPLDEHQCSRQRLLNRSFVLYENEKISQLVSIFSFLTKEVYHNFLFLHTLTKRPAFLKRNF
jgi:hypothetical protein